MSIRSTDVVKAIYLGKHLVITWTTLMMLKIHGVIITGLIQAGLTKIQGLLKTIIQFSRTKKI